MLDMFRDEEVYEFFGKNPATGAKLAYAKAHTASAIDEFVERRVDCVQDLRDLEDGCALYVEWKDGSFTVYYKKYGGWTIIVARR